MQKMLAALWMIVSIGCQIEPEPDPEMSDVTLASINCGGSQPVTCYEDNDGDGQGAGMAWSRCVCDAGYSPNDIDCNDANASVKHRTCYIDDDGDGHGAAGTSPIGICATSCASHGYVDDDNDYDDHNPDSLMRTCYSDVDGDGLAGTVMYTPELHCSDAWLSETKNDCDDGSVARYQWLDCRPDDDGDHYGHGATQRVCAGLTCAHGVTGFAESAGDCDDNNSAVRPFRTEIADNNVDDNCNDMVDDDRLIYSASGNANTDTSFAITLELKNPAEVAAATTTGLKAKISYRRLADAEGETGPMQTSAVLPMTIATSGSTTTASVTLTGLDPLTVYEVRLTVYAQDGVTRILPVTHTTLGANYNAVPYYTVTKPTGTSTPVKTARYNIILNALAEYDYFHTHSLGNWDHSLRNRYDLQADDTLYCSEFYATSAKPFLVDMNPCDYRTSTSWCDPAETSARESNTDAMRTWFRNHSTAIDAPDEAQLIASKPGDWLGILPTTDEPRGHHTRMLLAYNATAHVYWFVEGNGSDGKIDHTVNVSFESVAKDPNIGVCDPSCNPGIHLQTIGRLDDPRVLDP